MHRKTKTADLQPLRIHDFLTHSTTTLICKWMVMIDRAVTMQARVKNPCSRKYLEVYTQE